MNPMEVTTEHPDLAQLLPKDRAETVRRYRIITELNYLIALGKSEKLHAKGVVKAYSQMLRGNGVRLSVTSLYGWRRSYRLDRLAGLIDRRRLSKKHLPLASSYPQFLNLVRWRFEFYEGGGLAFRARLEFAHSDACRESDGRPWAVCGYRETFSFLSKELRTLPCVRTGAMPVNNPVSISLQSEFQRAS